ncbi:hypothetical protein ACNHKD_16055 [Methylocystis sp. JAN1]|uniref:hypothetical protein n=1 Tax=Methylocystis sp. JAN1 TaxID=3397211 RepID=UPI003FA2EE98
MNIFSDKPGLSAGSISIKPQHSSGSLRSGSIIFDKPNVSMSQSKGEDEILASLAPVQRLKYIASNRPGYLVVASIGVVAALYAIQPTILALFLDIASATGLNAYAQTSASHAQQPMNINAPAAIAIYNAVSRDSFILLLLAIALFWCLGLITFSKSAEKLGFAKDLIKLIIGYFVGAVSTSHLK